MSLDLTPGQALAKYQIVESEILKRALLHILSLVASSDEPREKKYVAEDFLR